MDIDYGKYHWNKHSIFENVRYLMVETTYEVIDSGFYVIITLIPDDGLMRQLAFKTAELKVITQNPPDDVNGQKLGKNGDSVAKVENGKNTVDGDDT